MLVLRIDSMMVMMVMMVVVIIQQSTDDMIQKLTTDFIVGISDDGRH